MKKVFTYLAIASFALVACQKETAIEKKNTPPAINGNIPTEIVCEISESLTKTQYAGNTTFGWTNGDQVAMVLLQTPESPNTSRWGISPYTTSADNGSASATFINGSKDLDTHTQDEMLGMIIYPSSIYPHTSWQESGTADDQNGHPVVTLPSAYTYSATNPIDSNSGVIIPMIGKKIGSTYKFATAVGILKVTINHMPSNAAKIVLTSAANKISEKLAVSNSSSKYSGSDEYIAQVAQTASGSPTSITINVSDIAVNSNHEFYFPIPVGTYPADDLSVKILDSGDNVLLSKTAKKAIIIARNEILSLPAFSGQFYQVSVTGASTNPQGVYTKYNAVIFFTVSTSSATLDRASYVSGEKYSHGDGLANNVSDTRALTYSGLSGSASSGIYYLHYVVAPLSERGKTCAAAENVITSGYVPFYFLNDTDASTYTGNYSTSGVINYPQSDKKNLIIAASNNPLLGNLMITEVFGRAYNGGDAKNGTPAYGIYLNGATSITFTDTYTTPHFFQNAGHKFYLCESTDAIITQNSAITNKSNPTFAITDGPVLTCANKLVFYYDANLAFAWGESGLQFSK